MQRNTILGPIPPITLNLIIINAIIWLAQIVFNRLGIDLSQYLGMHYFQAENFGLWQLITYAFLHDDHSLWHLFFNMFSLFMFGRSIEMAWGGKRYLLFYGICALTAAITQQVVWSFSLLDLSQSGAQLVNIAGHIIPKKEFLNLFVTVGASGAVFGLLLAFGMIFPNIPIYIWFIPIPVKAKYFVIFYGLIELFAGIAPQNTGSNVAHFAHIGGMIGGLILILLWRKQGKISKHPFI